MAPGWRVLAVAVTLLLAGCGGLLGGGATDNSQPETGTVTPAPVPVADDSAVDIEETETPPGQRNLTERYAALAPTCERPPGLVIHIQATALASDEIPRETALRVAWRFTAPMNKRFVVYEEFARNVETRYGPLLDADRIAYSPPERTGNAVTREVTVTADNRTTTYDWVVGRQGGELDGCWMTESIAEQGGNASIRGG